MQSNALELDEDNADLPGSAALAEQIISLEKRSERFERCRVLYYFVDAQLHLVLPRNIVRAHANDFGRVFDTAILEQFTVERHVLGHRGTVSDKDVVAGEDDESVARLVLGRLG